MYPNAPKLCKETINFLWHGDLLPNGHGVLMTREIAQEIIRALGLSSAKEMRDKYLGMEGEQKLDELSQSQLVSLWLEGDISPDQAIASTEREGTINNEKIMELIAHKMKMEKLT